MPVSGASLACSHRSWLDHNMHAKFTDKGQVDGSAAREHIGAVLRMDNNRHEDLCGDIMQVDEYLM